MMLRKLWEGSTVLTMGIAARRSPPREACKLRISLRVAQNVVFVSLRCLRKTRRDFEEGQIPLSACEGSELVTSELLM